MSNTGAIQIPQAEFVKYQENKSEYSSSLQKMTDLELSVKEYNDVLETLSGMDSTRRCFRIVETILVERNVEEVRSGIETEKERILEVMGKLNTRSRVLENEIIQFETKYGITRALGK